MDSEAQPVSGDVGDCTILIVDEDLELRSHLAAHLESAGYQVLTASTGIDALRFIRTKHPDLVLLAVQLPGWLDGFRVLHVVRTEDAIRDTPIVLLTEGTDTKQLRTAIELRVNDVVVKPYGLPDISARVQRLLTDRTVRRRSSS